VHVDVVRIAPKKVYSMGGHDHRGMNYHGVLVRVRTEDGVEGLGEVFMTPGWYGPDTPLSYIYLINKTFGPAIIGESVFNTAKIGRLMEQLWMGNLWTKAVLENALYDAAAKTVKRPLVDLPVGASSGFRQSWTALSGGSGNQRRGHRQRRLDRHGGTRSGALSGAALLSRRGG
jgi:L-alanine-DL-glutamate epimerase-like enolase superfamily enzyme